MWTGLQMLIEKYGIDNGDCDNAVVFMKADVLIFKFCILKYLGVNCHMICVGYFQIVQKESYMYMWVCMYTHKYIDKGNMTRCL